MGKLLYQGHGSFRIVTKNKTVIYLDPYAGNGYNLNADLVLVTHEHFDHNKISLVSLNETGTVLREKDFLYNGKYLEKKVNEVRIKATPAFNNNHDINECVGYLLSFENKILYFAGDTSRTPYMEDEIRKLHVNYCFLPTDGVYNMSAQEASICAELIDAQFAVPVHTNPELLFDEKIAEKFNPRNKFIIQPGEEIEI